VSHSLASTTDLVVFTAIFGARDTLKEPSVVTPGSRYICFTDEQLQSDIWEVVNPPLTYANPRREARRYKLLPHRFFECQYSLWVDGSFKINTDVRELIQRYLGRADIATFKHPDRDCIFDEATVCLQLGLDDPRRIERQMRQYRLAGFPQHSGLFSLGVLVRRHTPAVARLNEEWSQELEAGSYRDQLSFPFCIWRLGIACERIDGNIRKSASFQLIGHRTLRDSGGPIDLETSMPLACSEDLTATRPRVQAELAAGSDPERAAEDGTDAMRRRLREREAQVRWLATMVGYRSPGLP
jgi:hypothetical protein